MSSVGSFTVDGVEADDEDVLSYTWFPDRSEAPMGSVYKYCDGLDDLLFSLPRADIIALHKVEDW